MWGYGLDRAGLGWGQVASTCECGNEPSGSIRGCKLTHTREKRRLRVFENRVVRRIFGPKRDEVTGEWRKLHNEELNDLYCSPHIIRVIRSRRIRWVGNVESMGTAEAYTGYWWGNEGKRTLGRPRCRWEDNIKMDLQEIGLGGIRTGSSWLRIGTGGGHL